MSPEVRMFSDEDLLSEVEELFAEAQGAFEDAALKSTLWGSPDLTRDIRTNQGPHHASRGFAVDNPGFRVFTPSPPKDERQKRAMARHARKSRRQVVRERLLLGERPKTPHSKLWREEAAAMGIPYEIAPRRERRIFTQEFKDEMVAKARAMLAEPGRSQASVCAFLDVSPYSLRLWLKQADERAAGAA